MKRMVLAALVVASLASVACAAEDLARGFARPPQSARPWVYWFPLSGNLTKAGITADLEAMQRVGIGGVLYMEVDQGAPKGPADFAGPLWRELFRHACQEAKRLGLQINMNNDAGWCGSGGPWITPGAVHAEAWCGPRRPSRGRNRSPACWPGRRPSAISTTTSPCWPCRRRRARPASRASRASRRRFRSTFRRSGRRLRPCRPSRSSRANGIVDLTAQDGRPRQARLGRAPRASGSSCGSATPRPARTIIPRRLRVAGWSATSSAKRRRKLHFNALMGKLIAENRRWPARARCWSQRTSTVGKSGSQNWTPRMREEFRKRRGYDLLPLLPAFTGRVVDSLEVSERFLWDLRQTVSDLLIENYAGHFRELANRHGLRLSIEAYDGVPVRRDDLRRPGRRADGASSGRGASSARPTVAPRWPRRPTSTASRSSAPRRLRRPTPRNGWATPATSRTSATGRSAKGSTASCSTATPCSRGRTRPRPGMSMGPWGLHYERTQTWWEQSRAWHEYLARCQYLLQQGLFVADICYLQPEGAPRRFAPPPTALDRAVRPRRLQLRRLHAGSGAHPHEREGRPHRAARRHELPPAGIAAGRDDDAGGVGQDQGIGRGRGDGGGALAPLKVARVEQLPGLR